MQVAWVASLVVFPQLRSVRDDEMPKLLLRELTQAPFTYSLVTLRTVTAAAFECSPRSHASGMASER